MNIFIKLDTVEEFKDSQILSIWNKSTPIGSCLCGRGAGADSYSKMSIFMPLLLVHCAFFLC